MVNLPRYKKRIQCTLFDPIISFVYVLTEQKKEIGKIDNQKRPWTDLATGWIT